MEQLYARSSTAMTPDRYLGLGDDAAGRAFAGQLSDAVARAKAN